MTDNTKVKAYIGFSLRARKIVLGVNAVEALRKPPDALLICKSAAKNTRKAAESLARRWGLVPVEVDNLESLVNKENCKLCALTDSNLAKAIKAQLQDKTEQQTAHTPGGNEIE